MLLVNIQLESPVAIASVHSLASDLLSAGDPASVNPLLNETNGASTATLVAVGCMLVSLSW